MSTIASGESLTVADARDVLSSFVREVHIRSQEGSWHFGDVEELLHPEEQPSVAAALAQLIFAYGQPAEDGIRSRLIRHSDYRHGIFVATAAHSSVVSLRSSAHQWRGRHYPPERQLLTSPLPQFHNDVAIIRTLAGTQTICFGDRTAQSFRTDSATIDHFFHIASTLVERFTAVTDNPSRRH